MKKLSLAELNRLSVEEYKKKQKTPLIVVLDNIRSMHNIGSIFRTSDAFAIEKIYLCGITAAPPHKEITKTALGATETVDWEYRRDILELILELRENGTSCYAVEQTDSSLMLHEFTPPAGRKTAIILGNEVFGISDELLPVLDGALEIPQYGTKHSLNVTIAGGIAIWELFKKINGNGNM